MSRLYQTITKQLTWVVEESGPDGRVLVVVGELGEVEEVLGELAEVEEVLGEREQMEEVLDEEEMREEEEYQVLQRMNVDQ